MASSASDTTNKNTNNIAIGIDLGTTNSCVGVWQYGGVEIITNRQGNRITPSYVAFNDSGKLVGDAAKYQIGQNETNTVFCVKRLIGLTFADDSLKAELKHLPFEVENIRGKPKIAVKYNGENKLFTPEEISAMVLHEMKEDAEKYLGQTITNAVITVPAYFNEARKQATIDAGEIAGLNVLRILQEPTAAAIAFSMKMQSQGQKNVLVFDLGGGTLDVTVMTLENSLCKVKAIEGISRLGGEDFDRRMVDYFVKQIKGDSTCKNKTDISKNTRALVQLRAACETAKHDLSVETQATINIELTSTDEYVGTITRAQFEMLCDDLFKKTLEPVTKVLAAAKLDKTNIDDIILVGGSTRIPKIRRLLKEYFGKDLNTKIHAEEAVAYGAAIQAAILSDNYEELDMLLLDATPLSLGIRTAGGEMEVLISRNTTIPVQETKKFSPATDKQKNVLVQVYEGERTNAQDNTLLGRFQLTDLPTPSSRRPEIDVTFEVDANGILTVSALETSSGKENKKIFDNKDRYTKEEIKRMVREAEENRAADEQCRQRMKALNDLKKLILHIKTAISLEKFISQVSPDDQQKIKNKIVEIENWTADNSDVEREKYQQKREELDREYNAMVGVFRNLNVSQTPNLTIEELN